MIARKLNSREQKILIVCMALIVIFVSYQLLIKPFKNGISSAQEKKITLQKQLRKHLEVIEEARQIEKKYEFYKSNYKQGKTDEQLMSSLLSEIEGVAGELGLNISDLKPKRVRNEELFNRFSISLAMDSEFKDVMHFLYLLQGPAHQFIIEELRFDKGMQRNQNSVKSYLVLGKIFIP